MPARGELSDCPRAQRDLTTTWADLERGLAVTLPVLGKAHLVPMGLLTRCTADIDVVSRCSCSLCKDLATAIAIVKPSAFRLLSGEASLTDYGRPLKPWVELPSI
jgi:hypothetical protein